MKCQRCGHNAKYHYDFYGVAACACQTWVRWNGGLTGAGDVRQGECQCQTRNKRVIELCATSRDDALAAQEKK
jgi:hypothetical protein